MIHRLIVLALMFAVFASTSPAAVAADSAYALRSNRMEGMREVRTGGVGITLLSFIAFREPLDVSDAPVLTIRFFLPDAGNVYIKAVELRRHGSSHYQMKPLQVAWMSGWQEFAPWPTKDVLKPEGIPVSELGIVARLGKDRAGSGHIAPIVLYAGDYPQRSQRYILHLLPAATLSKVDYQITHVASGKIVVRKRVENTAANAPFKIEFDLTNKSAGEYRLLIKAKEWGKTKGPSRQHVL